MTEQATCKKCGSELPANAPAGVCPRCLLQAGLLESSPEVSAATDATILTDSTAPSDRTNDLPTVREGASSKTIPEPGEKIRYFGEYTADEPLWRAYPASRYPRPEASREWSINCGI